MKPLTGDLLGTVILGCAFGAIMLAAEVWTRRRHPDPEYPRKLVHAGSGAGALLFPFFISSPLVVALMAAGFATFLHIGQRRNWLRCLTGVQRVSSGAEYYPLAVAFLFFVSRDRWWLYFTAILILGVSDAAAAIIGKRFGRWTFQVGPADRKSVEGSLVFLLFSWVFITGLLAAMGGFSWGISLYAGFLVALLLTATEAISIRGTDNLFVPAMTAFVLLKITTKPFAEVQFQVGSMLALAAFLILLTSSSRIFTVRNSIVLYLFIYATWSLGGIDWCVPILIAFCGYCLCRRLQASTGEYPIATRTLLRAISIPLVILFTANTLNLYKELFNSYLAACSATFILCCWSYVLRTRPPRHRLLVGAGAACVAAISVAIGTRLVQPAMPAATIAVLIAITLPAWLLYDRIMHALPAPAVDRLRARPIWGVTLAASLAALLLQLLQITPVWHPGY